MGANLFSMESGAVVGTDAKKINVIDIWTYILLCFSIIILFCSIKNYFIYALYHTPVCQYICPSAFGHHVYELPVFLSGIFTFQTWIIQSGQNCCSFFIKDEFHIFSYILAAPLVEELVYRGPLFVLLKRVNKYVWWILAVVLSLLFSLSHNLAGLSLLPLFILGLASSWLVIKTRKFWPCLALHALYNFHVISFSLYQSIWGD